MRGRPEDQIAAHVGISANTITYYRRQIYDRLGVHNRGELQTLLFTLHWRAVEDSERVS